VYPRSSTPARDVRPCGVGHRPVDRPALRDKSASPVEALAPDNVTQVVRSVTTPICADMCVLLVGRRVVRYARSVREVERRSAVLARLFVGLGPSEVAGLNLGSWSVRHHGWVAEARYDGLAAWYDEWAGGYMQPFADVLAAQVAEFVTPDSTVIDVGCGTGLHFSAVQALHVHPIGVDLSFDQLRLARKRSAVVRADAARLPVRDKAIDAAVAGFVHRDVDDFAGTVVEVARVLRPGGRFISVGTHPCFVASFIDRTKESDIGTIEVRRGYGDNERRFDSAAQSRLATTVGSRNLPLTAFLHTFLGAGLRIESLVELDTRAQPWVAEPDDQTILPWNILVVAAKS